MLIQEDATDPIVIAEEEDEVDLADIPEAVKQLPITGNAQRKKRGRADINQAVTNDTSDEDASALFVADNAPKRSKLSRERDNEELAEDDKKKLSLNTSYDGFSIYGRILCLVVKRRGGRTESGAAPAASSQQMLENWVSTQAAAEQVGDDEEAG